MPHLLGLCGFCPASTILPAASGGLSRLFPIPRPANQTTEPPVEDGAGVVAPGPGRPAWIGFADRPAHLHRAPARRLLRRAAGRGAGHRGMRVQRLLPLRPPDGVRRRRTARTHRLVGDARRAGARDHPGPPGHVGHVDDVPLSRDARHRRGAGRRHERRASRARPGWRMVRSRAPGARRPLPAHPPAAAAARGAAADPEWDVGHAGRREVQPQG